MPHEHLPFNGTVSAPHGAHEGTPVKCSNRLDAQCLRPTWLRRFPKSRILSGSFRSLCSWACYFPGEEVPVPDILTVELEGAILRYSGSKSNFMNHKTKCPEPEAIQTLRAALVRATGNTPRNDGNYRCFAAANPHRQISGSIRRSVRDHNSEFKECMKPLEATSLWPAGGRRVKNGTRLMEIMYVQK